MRDYEQEEKNRQIVLKMFSASSFEENLQFITDDYKQHNPAVADGKAGVIEFFTQLGGAFPDSTTRVARCIAEGDMVWVHAHLIRYPGDRGIALVDIMKMKDGKVIEHWDVMQEVPETSINGNTMF